MNHVFGVVLNGRLSGPRRGDLGHEDCARRGVWPCDDGDQGTRRQRRDLYPDGELEQVRQKEKIRRSCCCCAAPCVCWFCAYVMM